MLLPLADRPRLSSRRAWLVSSLAAALLLVHGLRWRLPVTLTVDGPQDALALAWAHPAAGGSLRTLVGHLLLHGDGLHLAVNLFFLLVFGPNVERRLGPAGALAVFLAGGVAGGLAFSAWASEGHLVGASAGALSLTLCHAVALPGQRVLVFVWLVVVWVGELPTRVLAAALVALDAFALASGAYAGGRIAVPAHVAGLAAGGLLGLVARRLPVRPALGARPT